MVQLGDWLFSMAKHSSLYKGDQGPVISSLYKYELSPFCRMKRVLGRDGGDDTTIMCVYLMPLQSTLRSGEDGEGYVRCRSPWLYNVCSCALTVACTACGPCCGHDSEWQEPVTAHVARSSGAGWSTDQIVLPCGTVLGKVCKLCPWNWKPGSEHLIYLQGLWERLTLEGDVNMRWVWLFPVGREEFQHWGIGRSKGYEVRIYNSMCLSNGRKTWRGWGNSCE